MTKPPFRVSTPEKRLLLCGACKQAGKERIYRSIDGFRTHLAEYHGAKPDDLVRMDEVKPAPAEVNDAENPA